MLSCPTILVSFSGYYTWRNLQSSPTILVSFSSYYTWRNLQSSPTILVSFSSYYTMSMATWNCFVRPQKCLNYRSLLSDRCFTRLIAMSLFCVTIEPHVTQKRTLPQTKVFSVIRKTKRTKILLQKFIKNCLLVVYFKDVWFKYVLSMFYLWFKS